MTAQTQKLAGVTKSGSPLRTRDFRLLFIGETISLAGDAFAMVALPWLVLALTANPLALGTVLALTGIPRALLMLMGGAVVDRFSPRRVMLASNAARMILVSILAATILSGTVQVWMLYAFGVAFGVADAFYLPGQSAILARILGPGQLAAGNAMVGAAAQLAMIVGPMVAGSMIGLLAGPRESLVGLGVAFAIDAVSFTASLAALSLMAPQPVERTSTSVRSLLASVGEGLAFAWRRPAFRSLLLLIVAVQAVIVGPFGVGLPVLIEARLGDASAYGLVVSAFGGGALIGMILAGVLPQPRPASFGRTILAAASGLGVGLVGIALAPSTFAIAAIALLVGTANGYVGILLSSWLQPRIPLTLVGRVMSLVMFAFVAVVPLSSPIAGVLLAIDPVATFIGAGMLMTALVLAAATRPTFRHLGFEPLAAIDPSASGEWVPTDTATRAAAARTGMSADMPSAMS